MKKGYAEYESPLGTIRVIADEEGIKRVEIFEEDWDDYVKEHQEVLENQEFCSVAVRELCDKAVRQLDEYFRGERTVFDLPLAIEGTEFRKKVWKALQTIPYGEVRSYADVAEMIGNPKSVRAVGQANKANQLPIIIPCHRVIGKSGSLVGFAGNRTPFQRKLLENEGFRLEQQH
jgi:methylated-DNA-[protein]-cysteine S-methyltransferase